MTTSPMKTAEACSCDLCKAKQGILRISPNTEDRDKSMREPRALTPVRLVPRVTFQLAS